METVLTQLRNEAQVIRSMLEVYLLEYSSISYRGSDPYIIRFSDYEWNDLSTEGKQKRSALFTRFNNFCEMVEFILAKQPDDIIYEFSEHRSEIHDYITQNNQVWISSTKEVFQKVVESLNRLLSLIDFNYSNSFDSVIVVPDTNALLFNPNIEEWSFQEFEKYDLLLLPTVLSELDKLKIYGKSNEFRDKAKGVLNRIKEYRRRGLLTEGVTLKSGFSNIKAIAIEPTFEKTLSWLDSNNNDDRILTSFLEVTREYLNCSVLLVTSDINLQNKAEFARLPFIEPPGN
jgi:hypothetical protein